MNYYHQTAIESQGGKIDKSGKRIEVYTQEEINAQRERAENLDKLNEYLLAVILCIMITLSTLAIAVTLLK